MKILLIYPRHSQYTFEKYTMLFNLMPLGLPWLASVTPADDEVSIIDENIQKINFEEEVDLVGINALTSNVRRAYQISDIFRSKGIPTIIRSG